MFIKQNGRMMQFFKKKKSEKGEKSARSFKRPLIKRTLLRLIL